MLLLKIIEENQMLRRVNDGYDELLEIERAEVRKLRQDNAVITEKYIQASALLEDAVCIKRHESDYSEGVTA